MERLPADALWCIVDGIGRPEGWRRLSAVSTALRALVGQRARVHRFPEDDPGLLEGITDLVLVVKAIPLSPQSRARWRRAAADVQRLDCVVVSTYLAGCGGARATRDVTQLVRGVAPRAITLRLRRRTPATAAAPTVAGPLLATAWAMLAGNVLRMGNASLAEADVDCRDLGLSDGGVLNHLVLHPLPPGLRRLRLDVSGNRLRERGTRAVCRSIALLADLRELDLDLSHNRGGLLSALARDLLGDDDGGGAAGTRRPHPGRLRVLRLGLRGLRTPSERSCTGALCRAVLRLRPACWELDLRRNSGETVLRFVRSVGSWWALEAAASPDWSLERFAMDLTRDDDDGPEGGAPPTVDHGQRWLAVEALCTTLALHPPAGSVELRLGGLLRLDLTAALELLTRGSGTVPPPRSLSLTLGPTHRGSRYCHALLVAVARARRATQSLSVALPHSRLGSSAAVWLGLLCRQAHAPRSLTLDLTGNPDLLVPDGGGGALGGGLQVLCGHVREVVDPRRRVHVRVAQGDLTAVWSFVHCMMVGVEWPTQAPELVLDLRGCHAAVRRPEKAPSHRHGRLTVLVESWLIRTSRKRPRADA